MPPDFGGNVKYKLLKDAMFSEDGVNQYGKKAGEYSIDELPSKFIEYYSTKADPPWLIPVIEREDKHMHEYETQEVDFETQIIKPEETQAITKRGKLFFAPGNPRGFRSKQNANNWLKKQTE